MKNTVLFLFTSFLILSCQTVRYRGSDSISDCYGAYAEAIESEDMELFEFLVKNYDPRACRNIENDTPLHYAVKTNKLNLLQKF